MALILADLCLKRNDQFHYTLLVANHGSVPVLDTVLTDLLQEGLRFVHGSVTIDGRLVGAANPEKGIALGSLVPGQTVKIVFKVKAIFVPSKRKVENLAHASFRPEGTNQSFQVSSNVVVVHILEHEE
ncbi:DUF11 domain-containing protein [Paenibacillus sp. GM2]|uniref:DUF11 domain-containing protein n=1 Tax=Paenibacillus sp. GM2 TaxID=1622070 RepID=UPI00189F347C|nr:DUF11 domain-containing protein [Paenibacillus sp. GM2]